MKQSVAYRLACSVVLLTAIAPLLLAAKAQKPGPAAKSDAAHSGNLQNGKRLYLSDGCYECHGRVGQGSIAGPRIAPRPVSLARLVEYCRHPSGEMPPYTGKVISDAELADIYAFLQSVPEPVANKPPH